MAGGFTDIDLTKIAFPDIVETLDFEQIFQDMITDLQARDDSFDALVESDPAFKVLEVAAYRETLIRQRVNDGAKAVMLAYAQGADLENLAAFSRIERKVIEAGDPNAIPPIDPVFESDDDFRRRVQLAPEGISVAGPDGAYIFHALSVPEVADASVNSPTPGEVVVVVLGRDGDGTPDPQVISDVEAVLSNDDVRPLTDNVLVEGASIVNYQIDAEIFTFNGPDPDVVMAEARQNIERYIDNMHQLGLDITISGIHQALHVGGVQRVELTQPTASIEIAPDEASFNNKGSDLVLTHGGISD